MEAFRAMFLPAGFPQSVSQDYVAYQVWDTLQGLMGYFKYVILTFSFLRGLGLGGDGGAAAGGGSTVRNAVVFFVARDCIHLLAGLAFGVPALTERFSGRKSIRRYRLLAKVIRALNGVVELASGALYGGRYFAHMQFLVSISNAACTVMSSQTRAVAAHPDPDVHDPLALGRRPKPHSNPNPEGAHDALRAHRELCGLRREGGQPGPRRQARWHPRRSVPHRRPRP
uniref:Protein root UVB sensitive/RUS domain-containing protein n=2 Tax=Phaeomonas parva TaxID=124430 RepID=A0A7S1U935_9STRA|mmetsp:Transcript_37353/g.116804  ORF Transcript_37353/g.116804 Transcript_37353/m.116804 type:complete len:227 (+) Transcript_37353:202-882(+)